MLRTVGVSSVKELLSQIPQELLYPALSLPAALSEQELTAHVKGLAAKNKPLVNFIGAGCYEHFIPAAVPALASRGEFLTAYTPYQAEASQGTLQTIYEFQSCICALLGMDVATASHYDGATALAEGVCAALRITGRKQVLIPAALHPHYKQVLHTYLHNMADVQIKEVPFKGNYALDMDALKQNLSSESSCFVLAQPNFFGGLEEAEEISALVHAAGALLVTLVNPLSLGILKSPAEYDTDIAVAEGQVLGNPMSFGGPGLGIMAAKKAYVRQLPGRMVGIAKDKQGRRSFVLTLQAREQHIRREKAASNICSNEALCALQAVIYLTLLGPQGLKEVAELNVSRAHELAVRLDALDGYEVKEMPFFNEFVLECKLPAWKVIEKMAEKGIAAGYALDKDFDGFEHRLLICATEMRTEADIANYVRAMEAI